MTLERERAAPSADITKLSDSETFPWLWFHQTNGNVIIMNVINLEWACKITIRPAKPFTWKHHRRLSSTCSAPPLSDHRIIYFQVDVWIPIAPKVISLPRNIWPIWPSGVFKLLLGLNQLSGEGRRAWAIASSDIHVPFHSQEKWRILKCVCVSAHFSFLQLHVITRVNTRRAHMAN